MPRIQAATVAEHRALQEEALLRAARDLLAETGEAPSLAEVGARAGLARSSVYQYYGSREDLLAAVVAQVFPAWLERVESRVAAAASPPDRLMAYVEVNVRLFTGPDQAVARALMRAVDPAVLQPPMTRFHESLQESLRAALAALGEPDPATMADIVDSAILRAVRDVPGAGCDGAAGDHEEALAVLRRLLLPYAEGLAQR